MAIFELLFDPNPGPRQGYVYSAAELGLHLSPAEWNAFLVDPLDLPVDYFDRVTLEKHSGHLGLREQILEMQTGDTDEQRRVKVWGAEPNPIVRDGQIADQNEKGAAALAVDVNLQADGLDTNWGHESLMIQAVLVTDLNAQEISEFFEALKDPLVHALQPVANAFLGERKRIVDVAALDTEKTTMQAAGGLRWEQRLLRSVLVGYTEASAAAELVGLLDTPTYTPPGRDYIPIQFDDTTSSGDAWHMPV